MNKSLVEQLRTYIDPDDSMEDHDDIRALMIAGSDRIEALERERDDLRERNGLLRDVLLAFAKKCATCKGTGEKWETIAVRGLSVGRLVGRCPDCQDLREVLK